LASLISAALAAHVPDPFVFRSGRDFAAWLGLVPRQNSSGGKEKLGRITKQGNPHLRRLLVLGATASLRWLHKRTDPLAAWTKRLLPRRPARLVTVALANKLARIAWAIIDDRRALPLGCSDSRCIAARCQTSFAGDGDDFWPVRSEVMNSQRTADQSIPNPDRRLERVELMRNLGRGYHHGQRAAASHQQAGHMTAC
jgi:hypothetical protein